MAPWDAHLSVDPSEDLPLAMQRHFAALGLAFDAKEPEVRLGTQKPRNFLGNWVMVHVFGCVWTFFFWGVYGIIVRLRTYHIWSHTTDLGLHPMNSESLIPTCWSNIGGSSTEAFWSIPIPRSSQVLPNYPLVNIQKTLENHNFEWLNQLFLGHFQ